MTMTVVLVDDATQADRRSRLGRLLREHTAKHSHPPEAVRPLVHGGQPAAVQRGSETPGAVRPMDPSNQLGAFLVHAGLGSAAGWMGGCPIPRRWA